MEIEFKHRCRRGEVSVFRPQEIRATPRGNIRSHPSLAAYQHGLKKSTTWSNKPPKNKICKTTKTSSSASTTSASSNSTQNETLTLPHSSLSVDLVHLHCYIDDSNANNRNTATNKRGYIFNSENARASED